MVAGRQVELLCNEIWVNCFPCSGNVSSALTSCSFYLARHPDRQDQVRAEVDTLIGNGTFDAQASYPVLESVIFESIRLQPLVPNGGERKAPRQGLVVLDDWIPGDTVLRVPSYTIFRGKLR
jgi:cytochrome P450